MKDITHVTLAFMNASQFNTNNSTTIVNPFENNPIQNFSTIRDRFSLGTKILMAIGGWGVDSSVGFSTGVNTTESRVLFANNVKSVVEKYNLDGKLELLQFLQGAGTDHDIGIDIDWEYPW